MTLHVPASARIHELTALVDKYDGRAPRYTSYPTAVQFTPAVDARTYRSWLGELPTHAPVSLYVHVPFCARLCWFCGCNTRAVNRHEPVAEYVDVLLREMRLVAEALPGRIPADAVHLGGGTPNMLSAADLDAVFDGLAGVFDLTPDMRIAAELDPASLTEDWVRHAARRGLARASLGVQNLDPAVQAAVNRHESYESVAAAVGCLRDAGVQSVNVDLMYGLPHQTKANTLSTLDAVMRLSPDRVALFGYAHVPWMKAHQKLIDEGALPWPAARLDQAEAAAERLQAEGYVRIGLDHFARDGEAMAEALQDGRLRRNFQGYTTDAAETLIGLGASAIGRLPQGFAQNAAAEVAWRAAVAAGELPTARGVALTPDDRFRGEIIERLMCDLSVDLGEVCRRHGRDLSDLDESLARLTPFMGDGLARLEGDRLSVVGHGRLVVRSVCAAFDTYVTEGLRHSRTL